MTMTPHIPPLPRGERVIYRSAAAARAAMRRRTRGFINRLRAAETLANGGVPVEHDLIIVERNR